MAQGYTKTQPLDTDVNLGGVTPSDYLAASQKATKTYVDNKLATQDIVEVSKLVASDGSPDPALAADAAGDLSTAYTLSLSGASKYIQGVGSNFPNLGTLTLANKWGNIYLGTAKDIYPREDNVGFFKRFVDRSGNITDHFRSGSIPTGYAWDTRSIFNGTPSILTYNSASDFMSAANAGSTKHYLSKSVTLSATQYIQSRCTAFSGAIAGVRMDDGVDAANRPFAEWYFENASGTLTLKLRYRDTVGGGITTTSTIVTEKAGDFSTIQLFINGSNNGLQGRLVSESGSSFLLTLTGTVTWMTTNCRIGLLVENAGFGTEFDSFYSTL